MLEMTRKTLQTGQPCHDERSGRVSSVFSPAVRGGTARSQLYGAPRLDRREGEVVPKISVDIVSRFSVICLNVGRRAGSCPHARCMRSMYSWWRREGLIKPRFGRFPWETYSCNRLPPGPKSSTSSYGVLRVTISHITMPKLLVRSNNQKLAGPVNIASFRKLSLCASDLPRRDLPAW